MADFDGVINPAASWPDVPQLGTSAVATGGPGGVMNAQAAALTARNKRMMRLHFEEKARGIGYTLAAGSFEDGATITSVGQLLLKEGTASVYSWTGAIPKSVTAGSLPTEPEWSNKTASSVADAVSELSNRTRGTIHLSEYVTDLTGTTDVTAAVQAAIDAAGSVYELVWSGTPMFGPVSSAASVRWTAKGACKPKQNPATSNGPWWITLTGPAVYINGIEFDGNQDATASGSFGTNGLRITGVSPTLVDVSVRDCNGKAHLCESKNWNSFRRGLYINCHFDDNAGLGLETLAASGIDFYGLTCDRNGYGWKQTKDNPADTTHGFVAFGSAIRMRSHHLNFFGGSANLNGRDGHNVNQGSYAVKYIGVTCWANDDGGFTIAADNTSTGLPGEGESCYDLEYDACEAYNNYTSGLVAYQAAHNVTVRGGRYYNNHRIAGDQSAAASFTNGIYFAAGSTGIDVESKTYDDRQTRVITGVSGGTLTATGWVNGLKDYYPKVAVYDGATRALKGYGKITAESSGSVTIMPTANNGVTLGSISVGDYVSQGVQHVGCLLDNGCNGIVGVDGFGHKKGVLFGDKNIISGAFNYSQNVLIRNTREVSGNLLANGSFDADILNWSFNTPGGGSATHETAQAKSAGSLRLIGGSSSAEGDAANVAGTVNACKDSFVEAQAWVYCDQAAGARLFLFWGLGGPTYDTQVQHPGGGWRLLKIGAYLPGNTSSVTVRAWAAAGVTTYFDSVSLKTVGQATDNREQNPTSRTLGQ